MIQGKSFVLTVIMLIPILLVSGCASNDSAGQASDPVEPLAEYLIGPGDELEIFVWRNSELSTTLFVRPDGKISTPLVEDMQAVGKTPTQLSRDLELALSEYVKSPTVNVIVRQFVGTFNDQIRVVGKAAQPRALSYRSNMTLLDVMIEVDGLAVGAAGNRAKVIRRYGGRQQEIPVRINDLLNKGQMSANIQMRPGDVLIIPESRF